MGLSSTENANGDKHIKVYSCRNRREHHVKKVISWEHNRDTMGYSIGSITNQIIWVCMENMCKYIGKCIGGYSSK